MKVNNRDTLSLFIYYYFFVDVPPIHLNFTSSSTLIEATG